MNIAKNTTKGLISQCEAARIAWKAKPKSKALENFYDAAYNTLFSQDRISSMLRSYENGVPGIVVNNYENPPRPLSWGIFPENTHVILRSNTLPVRG